jgi:hypothetical protein
MRHTGALASVGEAVEPSGPGALAHEAGQCRDGPQLSGQAMILGLGASHIHHPGLGRIGDLGFVRAVVLVLCPASKAIASQFCRAQSYRASLTIKCGNSGNPKEDVTKLFNNFGIY